jgi:NAD(P)-dependent dehydrogenase (short-subunit alcohol dehydrogenase family)
MTAGKTTQPWNEQAIPDQTGRVAVITGANSGTGFEAARLLVRHGATVVLGCRNPEKGKAALAALLAETPGGKVELEFLDLGSLASIRSAAEAIQARHAHVDLLLNNAGVMVPPYGKTADGFETQFGTNHLGHFAFTGLLLERLLATPAARIVTMSSLAHKQGRIRFDDLQFERGYRAWAAYGQSKLANLMFTYELQRRLELAHADTLALAAHPGWARTNLQQYATRKGWVKGLFAGLGALLSQTAAQGALPLVRAAVDPAARGGEYYGPSGCLEAKGTPIRVRSNARSHEAAILQRLWRVSEELTGVGYPL